ncbi:MAG TPA: hypothetical protein VGG10_13655 [Rhizomicrobium sp.]|jgi:hypothetical protein
MIKTIFVALLVLGTASSAPAAGRQPFGILPADRITACDGFADRSIAQQDIAAAWVAGFVAGVNTLDPDEQNRELTGSRSGVRTWLRAWCTMHSRESIAKAAIEYRYEIVAAGHS